MIRPCSFTGACGRRQVEAFTLIELLTVIAIILVLAGLLLNIAGNANYKSSFARAQAEVKAMETALEGYKADNGTYPRTAVSDGSTSDNIDPQTDNTNASSSGDYATSGKVLYQALSGYTNAGTAQNKTYIAFTPGQLSTGNAAPSGSTVVIDPFGLMYGYSTANLAAQDKINAGGAAPNPMPGYNPTFDLWSTGGYGTGGKGYPAGITAANYNTLWAKNW